MSKQIIVKAGKGNVVLEQSNSLVGLRTKTEDFAEKSPDVKSTHIANLGGFKVVELERKGEALDQALDDIRAHDEVEVGTHVWRQAGTDKTIVPNGKIIIQFAAGVSKEEQQMALSEYHLQVVERLAEDKVLAQVSKDSPNPLKTANLLSQTSLVVRAEPDLDMMPDLYDFQMPQDVLVQHQWHLKNEGFIADANYPVKKGADAKVVDAWRRLGSLGTNRRIIAVVDYGFDVTHPDLKDKIIKPIDLWTGSSELKPENSTHGTPCASVALASVNGVGIVGAAPMAKFMPLRGPTLSYDSLKQIFTYCMDNGAEVISCSWGSTTDSSALNPEKEDIIAKAAREGRNGKGCVICFAAGNEGLDYLSFYATHPDVIAVGASTSKDEHASYSNRGRELTLVAPSNGDWPITAARAHWDKGVSWESGERRFWMDGRNRSDQHKHFGGTSSATPLVAGICALILDANPDLTAKQVKDILIRTADKIGSPSDYVNGHSLKFGHGRINADKALAEAIRMREGGNPVADVVEEVAKGRGVFRFNVSRQPGVGFGVQIGAFYEYGNVLIQAEKLQATFQQPVIVSINELDGKTVYKIVLGAFDSADEARRLLATMRTKGFDGFVRNLKDL